MVETNTKSNGYDRATLDEFRSEVLDTNRRIVSGFEVAEDDIIPLPTQLAYLRALNIQNVDQLLVTYDSNGPQSQIDQLSEEAIRVHNLGRDVFWRAKGQIQRYGFGLIVDSVKNEEITDLCLSWLLSQDKVGEIEKKVDGGEPAARFPGLRKIDGVETDSFGLFSKIVEKYGPDVENRKYLGRLVELAYHSACDSLAIRNCFSAIDGGNVNFHELDQLCDDVRMAHQGRGNAFWETLHMVHYECYDRACKENAPVAEQERLRIIADMSGEKLIKLDTRNNPANGDTITDDLDSKMLIEYIEKIAKQKSDYGEQTLDREGLFRRNGDRFRLSSEQQGELLQLLVKSMLLNRR